MVYRRTLELEELGQRTLPSVTPFSMVIPHSIHSQAAPQAHPLAGQGQGTYTGNSLIVDAGVSDTLQGQANLARLGQVTVQGAVHGLGFIASGHATGTLTFTNDNGSVTLELKGPLQKGFSPLPTNWHYVVTEATGAYQDLQGEKGSLQLTLTPDTTPGSPPTLVFPSQGTFQLTIP